MSRKILKLAPERSHYFRFTHCGAGGRQRSELLERLLARADSVTAVTDWRADAFRVIAEPSSPMPSVAAAALFAERGQVDAASVFIATPVHYVAEMSNVRLPADGMLALRACEAEALAVDFNRVWSDAGIRMLSSRSANIFCLFEQPVEVATRDPEDLLDRLIDEYLPTGAAAWRLRQLMSEIEMWLFEHDVNRMRTAAAAKSVSGLWLWGGGPALRSLPAVHGWAAGNDPLFKALAGNSKSSPSGRSGVVVVAEEPGTEAWRDIESRWLGRALEDLRLGRIGRVDLSANNRCVSVRGHWRWRLWRRRRPWWESLA
jgi:hypothetical protein